MNYNHTHNNKVFHIATCNALNLALPNRKYYDNADVYSQTEYKQKIEGLTNILRHAKSDILVFQEVWDESALQEIAVNLGFKVSNAIAPLASNDKESLLTKGQGAKGTPALGLITSFKIVDYQLLTKFNPLAVIEIPDDSPYKEFNRPPLVVTLDINGQLVTVINTHLKSKRPHYLKDNDGNSLENYDDPKLRVRAKLRSLFIRAAEATALRLFIIDKLQNTHHPLILLGDMNDVTDSVTTQLLAETSEVIYDKSMRDIALFDATRVQTSLGGMKDVAYTHVFQGMPEIIDHIFISEEFLPNSKFSLGEVDRVDYFNDHLKRDYENRFSDHGIVRAKIKLS